MEEAARGIGPFLVLPDLFVDVERVYHQFGNYPQSVRSQRSGSHACPRRIPQRLLRRGLHILGLAYSSAPDKHPAARRRHLAAVQRLQVQRPPEEQRELLRRGGGPSGRTVDKDLVVFWWGFGDLSSGRCDD